MAPLQFTRIRYVLLAFAIGFLGGFQDFYGVYSWGALYPFGSLFVGAGVAVMAYAIVTYGVMDIRVAITRTLVFAGVYSVLLFAPLIFLFAQHARIYNLLGSSIWWTVPFFIGLYATTASIIPFIYLRIQSKIEARILREERRQRDLLTHASEGMTRVRNLKELLSLIVHITSKTLGLYNSAIFLIDTNTKQYTLRSVRLKSRYNNTIVALSQDDPLVKRLTAKDEPLVYEEVKMRARDLRRDSRNPLHEIESQMRGLGASLIVPASIGESLLGFLILGDKKNGRIYTQEDINLLKTLADEAALAIENAIFYQEDAERKALLYQSAILSDLGTMADSMGHQIKNHLQKMMATAGSEAGILEELLKQELSPEKSRELLLNVVSVLGKIEEQGKIGAVSIETIRKFSTLSLQEFSYVKIEDFLAMAKDVLQFKVKFDEFDFVVNIPKDLPSVYAHPILTEAFVNLIDNAYDAIKEKEETLELQAKKSAVTPAAYHGKIVFQIKLTDSRKEIDIKISDNGIGIKEEKLGHLFLPFYTTKATSAKGTGLGLYVIKNIVNNHKGRITVDSKYMQGTAFTITLPIKQEEKKG